MAAIFAQVRRDPIRTRVFGHQAARTGSGIIAAARIAHSRHVIDIHTKPQCSVSLTHPFVCARINLALVAQVICWFRLFRNCPAWPEAACDAVSDRR